MACQAAKLENDLGRDPIPQLVLRIAIPSPLASLVVYLSRMRWLAAGAKAPRT